MSNHILTSATALLSLLALEDATAEARNNRVKIAAATVSTATVKHTPAPAPALVGDHFGHVWN